MPRLHGCLIVGVLLSACGGDDEPSTPDAVVALPTVDRPEPPPPIPDPAFPEGTRSLRLIRSIAVRLTPGADESKNKRIGTLAQDTRVGWTSTEKADGCKKPWVEVTPRGWVCGDYLEASERAPSGVELPRLERGEIVPGIYGKVVEEGAMIYQLPEGKAPAKKEGPVTSPDDVDAPAPARGKDPMLAVRPLIGAVNVRQYGEISYGDKTYWKISRGNEYMLAKSIYRHKPSTFQGVRLGDDTGLSLPLAFVWPKQRGVKQAWIRRDAKGRGALRQVEQRTALPILETAEVKGKPFAYRIGEGEWILADQVRVAAASDPPPLIGEHERWFDIDLDTQILVAYEGRVPVYVTMVSTGKKEKPTATGMWRMWKKVSEQDLGKLSGEDPYSVATVPWTQFFDPSDGLALHAAYWHDQFGIVKSRGCINLSPIDARWLYFWSEPITPPGWTMTAGVVEAPGSIVRVRSAADPSPVWKGYAIKVQEAREKVRRP